MSNKQESSELAVIKLSLSKISIKDTATLCLACDDLIGYIFVDDLKGEAKYLFNNADKAIISSLLPPLYAK